MLDFTPLRSMVQLFLTDVCTITAAVAPVFDPDTGTYPDDDSGSTVYTGPCRMQPFRLAATVDVGEVQMSKARFICKLPWDVTGVAINDVVEITESTDAQFVGRRFRVTDVQGETQNAQRELYVEDLLDVDRGS